MEVEFSYYEGTVGRYTVSTVEHPGKDGGYWETEVSDAVEMSVLHPGATGIWAYGPALTEFGPRRWKTEADAIAGHLEVMDLLRQRIARDAAALS